MRKPTRIVSVRYKDNNYGVRGTQRIRLVLCNNGQEYQSRELAELVGVPMRTLCERLNNFEKYEEAIFYPYEKMKAWKTAKAKVRREEKRAAQLAARDPERAVNKGNAAWQALDDAHRDERLKAMRQPTKYDKEVWR